MTLTHELHTLKLADVLAVQDLTQLYAVKEADYQFLNVLSVGSKEAIRSNRVPAEVQGFQTAAMALRAIILAAKAKPFPAIELFLRKGTEAAFYAAVGYFEQLPLRKKQAVIEKFYGPIVYEAEAALDPEGPAEPTDLTGAICKGLGNLYPVLSYLANKPEPQAVLEANK